MTDASPSLLKPDLYEAGETGAGQESKCLERRSAGVAVPLLRGGRCDCGYVFFPMQTFGCERCGRTGDALQPHPLIGRGRLRSAATVHVHADEKRKTPFVIGTVALDGGPIIRTLLLDAVDDRAALGMRVEAVLVPVDLPEQEKTVLDLRFRAESST